MTHDCPFPSQTRQSSKTTKLEHPLPTSAVHAISMSLPFWDHDTLGETLPLWTPWIQGHPTLSYILRQIPNLDHTLVILRQPKDASHRHSLEEHTLQALNALQIRDASHLSTITAAAKGCLHELQWLHERHAVSNHVTLEAAVVSGHQHIVEFFLQNHIAPTPKAIFEAAEHGHVHILQTIYAYQPPNPHTSEMAAKKAATKGHIHILQYYKQLDSPLGDAYLFAIRGNQTHTFKWCLQHIGPVTTPSAACVFAAQVANFEILNILHHELKLPPVPQQLEVALCAQNVKLYEWLINFAPIRKWKREWQAENPSNWSTMEALIYKLYNPRPSFFQSSASMRSANLSMPIPT